MRLSKLKLNNFKCFGDKGMVIPFDDMTAFIGNNSSGKTAAMEALSRMFGISSRERTIRRQDFHIPNGGDANDVTKLHLTIEAVFVFDEVSQSGAGRETIPTFFDHVIVERPGEAPILRVLLEATWEKSPRIDGSIDSRFYYLQCKEDDEVLEENKVIASRAALDNILFMYVPAIRNPEEQLRNVNGTLMHHMLGAVNWSDDCRDKIKSKIDEINQLFKEEDGVDVIAHAINDEWGKYGSGHKFAKTELSFNGGDMENAVRNSQVLFYPSDDGRKCDVGEIGDGMRSLFYISLTASILDVLKDIRLAKARGDENVKFDYDPPALVILGVEEPENHIAPHLLGQVVSNFLEITKQTGCQTVLTSHSASIVGRIPPECIRYFRHDQEGVSSVQRVPLPTGDDDAVKYLKGAVQAFPELYFAKLVILCEGDSEQIVLPRFLEVLTGRAVDRMGISIVPLGGRHVNHFWKLLEGLQIPYVTLLDLDCGRFGGGWGRIKYAIEQLLEHKGSGNIVLQDKNGDALNREGLNMLHERDAEDKDGMRYWINWLEQYNVFYSAPLDLDFMMLKKFPAQYKDLPFERKGPLFKGKDGLQYLLVEMERGNYPGVELPQKRIDSSVQNVLKDNGVGGLYSDDAHELMVWYDYLFLTRSKPSTHMHALALIKDEMISSSAPSVLKRLADRARQLAGVV